MIADSEQPPGQEVVTDSQLWRIDQICDGFETAWNSTCRPQIETFVAAATGPGRQLLLRELVILDVDYRKRHGETPGVTDYRHRFPELTETWLLDELAPDRLDDVVDSRAAVLRGRTPADSGLELASTRGSSG